MAGCTTYYDPPPPVAVKGTTVPAPTASSGWKPGAGVIQSISLGAPSGSSDSASAGGSAPAAVTGMGPYHMTLRMDDGSVQTLAADNRAFLVGDRVQVSPEGRMIRQQQ
jgi:hypothetical protein